MLTHLNEQGHIHQVDVSGKPVTLRTATAEASVRMRPETLAKIQAGGHPKGDVFATVRLAGIQAAKRTDELIPLCHSLPLEGTELEILPDASGGKVNIRATCTVQARTGVEMEAMTAVSVAALTLYDMCKSMDRGMQIDGVRLLEKSGGRSGHWKAGDS